MKKTLLSLVLCAMCARAGAQTVTVADVEAVPGETVAFTLDLAGGKANTYTALQFEAQFPATGFNTTGDYSVSPLWRNTSSTINSVDADGKVTIPVASSEAISAADVVGLLTINFTVGSDVALGDYDVTLTNLWFGYGTNSKDYLSDVTFKVRVVAIHTVVLDENSTEAPEASDGVVDVRVKRTIAANQWSTICLPFAMTEAQVAEAFGNDVQLGDFGGYETAEDDDENIVGITVKFNTLAENAIEANHPYIIKVLAPVTEFSVSSVEIDPEEEPTVAAVRRTKKQWSEMIGTYVAGTELEALTLFLSGNKFYYSAGLTKMKAYRAYFDFYDALTDVEEAYSGVKMSFNIDGVTTDIDEIENSQSSNSGCFDLSGRRVAKPTQRGVYVVGGHKVAVR